MFHNRPKCPNTLAPAHISVGLTCNIARTMVSTQWCLHAGVVCAIAGLGSARVCHNETPSSQPAIVTFMNRPWPCWSLGQAGTQTVDVLQRSMATPTEEKKSKILIAVDLSSWAEAAFDCKLSCSIPTICISSAFCNAFSVFHFHIVCLV